MSAKPTVFYPLHDSLTVQMFHRRGFGLAINVESADILCFTGGADVSPHYYGEAALPVSMTDQFRDAREAEIFEKALLKPKVGICRGGQFLNVMSGGQMWQDVDNHAIGKSGHIMTDLVHNVELQVSSTHHQMMRPSELGRILGIANEAKHFTHNRKEDVPAPEHDVEIVAYEASNSLCFQPHPEYGNKEEQDLFFKLLKMLWDLEGVK